MKIEDIAIPTGCATRPDDRTKVLESVDPDLGDPLSVVDEAERFGQTPPEGSAASWLAFYGHGGESNG